MKFLVVALGTLACVGTVFANVACDAACAKMQCFSSMCLQKGYATTVTVTGGSGNPGGKAQPTVTKTCTRTVTSAATTGNDAGGKGGEVKTVTVTDSADEEDDLQTVTKVVTKTCTKTVKETIKETVTVKADEVAEAGGY
ncbi:hypothetical protein TWF173_002785 [Orbilia oligospora]|uniref:Extracellular membrane protein CFEM domain-containing protein n=2 Tax=Orbilia oligospora TaxID=2813651 RepID=G1X6P2_ARTOA|nr:hypothetical protein AOL_s00054g536 [Orbilia oligospora ATCC 24927]EGX51160.1 hypothetical protein AOL_s00054g536 [Orbilia oligospora ATCC 24927]KAF3279799.1 hypothetical protein TWF970_003827 [Orbilia oligospora]KAF3316004.1 hypothetical protein TWF173_002785 [Orbilia oligospora]